MGRVILDTDILVDFLRGVDKAVKMVEDFIKGDTDICTTSINAFELYWGSFKLGKSKRVDAVDRLLTHLNVINFTQREARACGEEMAYLESIGMQIDIRDLIIGVLTRENNGAIVTGNVKHFSRIRNLSTLRYERK